MGTDEATMPHDARHPGVVSLIGWSFAILFGTAMIIGGFLGYSDAHVEKGGAPLPSWLGPLAALAFAVGAFALLVRRHRAAWGRWSPRKRRYGFALVFCALIGGVVGGWFSAQRPDDGSMMEAITQSPLTPAFAIGASLLWLGGLAIGMTLYHRAIDDHEERAWLWAGLAGWYAFIFPAPVWWALHRAALAPAPDIMLMILFSMIVNGAVYLWLKFR